MSDYWEITKASPSEGSSKQEVNVDIPKSGKGWQGFFLVKVKILNGFFYGKSLQMFSVVVSTAESSV